MKTSHIKDSQSYHFSATAPKKERGLSAATIIALALHGFLIFGITFGSGFNPADKAQDVAVALTQNLQENAEAHFIANASQQGGGQSTQQLRLETTQVSPMNAESMTKTQDIINQKSKVRQKQYQESYLRTTLSWREVNKANENEEVNKEDELIEQEERLRKQIATLEAQLSQRQQSLAQKTKVETVNSNSTTHGKASEYLEQFRQHVEAVGNASYPQQARLQGIQGNVMLMVIIENNGNIKGIRLLESSGSKILDEAAKQSVRQAAPFGPFSQDMQDILELRIIRTWQYGDSVSVNY